MLYLFGNNASHLFSLVTCIILLQLCYRSDVCNIYITLVFLKDIGPVIKKMIMHYCTVVYCLTYLKDPVIPLYFEFNN